ncbi:hypothetical protein K7X08_002688 [Anisodus acutangulus]|uniref:Uncharacterized protein n=1 Tax=Anisodus acutangulus TaxID=402998 RepID=A0A9Q1KZ44_9SOLA|nr:hypothetical protein K7X08_002688 [Anisodus acutangulus]
MAMRMDVGFNKGMVCPIATSCPFHCQEKLAYGSSNSRLSFIAKNGNVGVVYPIAALSLSLPRMAMRMDVGFTMCGSSNSRFFVPFIAKNGNAYGLALQRCGMVCPIATSLSLSLPRMAMRMEVGFYKVYGSSNSRFLTSFIAKNGNAYGRWLYKDVCGSSNSRLFVPFIAKNGNAYGRLAFTKCGSSNSRLFVPFIAKNGNGDGTWLYKDVGMVHPIVACLSHSLPKVAMHKWTLALTVYGLSNNRFFVPFIPKNGDAEVDVGFYSV